MKFSMSHSWKDLERVLSPKSPRQMVMTPFFSSEGLNRLSAYIDKSRPQSIVFATRFTLRDWAAGSIDPIALTKWIKQLPNGTEAVLLGSRSLHAKLYFSEATGLLVTSSNLTNGGFESNLEASILLRGAVSRKAFSVIESTLGQFQLVSTEDLDEWTKNHRALVSKSSREVRDAYPAGRELLDPPRRTRGARASSRVGTAPRIRPRAVPSYDEFLHWLQTTRGLPEAAESLAQARGKSNLSGHVKQSYYAAMLYFQQHRREAQAIDALVRGWPRLSGFVPISEVTAERWNVFLNANRNQSGLEYNMATLHNQLTPRFGGTRLGGGGANPSFQRVFPLAAAFFMAATR